MGFYDVDNLDHDQQLAQAMGNMVTAWAAAETALVFVLAAICSLDVNAAIAGYYRIPTFEARTKFIRALIPEWKTTKFDKAAICSTIGKLNALATTRNEWVHGVWCMDRESKETFVFNFRREVGKGRRKPIKATDVATHSQAVRSRTNELHALVPGVPLA